MAEPTITVEVVHAGVEQVWRRRVVLAAGSTVAQAIVASGLPAALPQALLQAGCFGIHARRVEADQVLRDGDRVEIYRPLTLDPMAARRRRARGA